MSRSSLLLRPQERVFDMEWQPPPDQEEQGRKWIADRRIDVPRLRDCVTGHR